LLGGQRKYVTASVPAGFFLQGGANYLHEKWPDFLMFICREAEKTAIFV